ncbi:MAG: hypothetical protein U9O50_08985 [Acidobacteriota bacterium]|nr:hypothetical protein [Acidobacteriota bacterium]
MEDATPSPQIHLSLSAFIYPGTHYCDELNLFMLDVIIRIIV